MHASPDFSDDQPSHTPPSTEHRCRLAIARPSVPDRDDRVEHSGRHHAHSARGNSPTRPRIVIIETDSTPTMWLTRRLTEQGFSIVAESSNRRFNVGVEECDVMILDFDSADEDAPSVVRAMRAVHPNLPMIVLDRGDPFHAARVLNSGADDYMTKPYRFDELRARIDVRLRTAAPHSSDTIAACDFRLDWAARR